MGWYLFPFFSLSLSLTPKSSHLIQKLAVFLVGFLLCASGPQSEVFAAIWRCGTPSKFTPMLDHHCTYTWFIPQSAGGKASGTADKGERGKNKLRKHRESSKILQIMISAWLKRDIHFSVSFSFFPIDFLNLGHRQKNFFLHCSFSSVREGGKTPQMLFVRVIWINGQDIYGCSALIYVAA